MSLRAAGIRVVILDIEGTTTPIAFVHDVLFPFAHARVRTWLESTPASDPARVGILDGLRAERARESGPWKEAESQGLEPGSWKLEAIVSYVHWLMSLDRKSHALKQLQGKIWEEGYASGELKGDVYADVRPALEAWTDAGIGVGIFSSGSVLAQKLLFANSTAGDLTRFLSWHFDTAIGAKIESASYARLAEALARPPGQILFVSDVTTELDAARASGIETRLCVRSPAALPPRPAHQPITSFAELPV
jgi:enolase-phosphatase E1